MRSDPSAAAFPFFLLCCAVMSRAEAGCAPASSSPPQPRHPLAPLAARCQSCLGADDATRHCPSAASTYK